MIPYTGTKAPDGFRGNVTPRVLGAVRLLESWQCQLSNAQRTRNVCVCVCVCGVLMRKRVKLF